MERLFLGEIVLANTAQGADEVVGEGVKGGAGSDAMIGIAQSLFVDPAADVANIFLHI